MITLTGWIIIAISTAIAVLLLTRPRKQVAKYPPEYKVGIPFIGTALAFGDDPHGVLATAYHKLGDVFRMNLGIERVYVLIGAKAHDFFFNAPESVMSLGEGAKRFAVNLLGDTQNDVLGKKQGYDADWIGRGMRPYYATFFPNCIQKQLKETYGSLADSGEVVPFYKTCSKCITLLNTLSFIGEKAHREFGEELAEKVEDLETYGADPLGMILPVPARFKAKKARERLISIFTEIAEERKHSNTEEPGLLHVLLEMGATNLHGKLLGVFFAAHTNAAGTMFWLFVNLMTHPEKLAKVQEEQRRLREDYGEQFDATLLSKMPYLTACVRETIRMYSLLFLFRKAMTDLEFEGYHIPKGTQIAVSPAIVHNDPKYYDNPREFRPERWLEDPERVAIIEGSRVFVPFGYGPHRCSGERFAMQTMTMTMSYVFANYTLELEGAPKDKPWPVPIPDYRKAVGMPTPMKDLMVRVRRL